MSGHPRLAPFPARLRVWRDAVLTAAAFSLVLAAVIGIGPFDGGRSVSDVSASVPAPFGSRLADLSR